MLLIILVHLSCNTLQIKYLKVSSLILHLISLVRLPLIRIKIFQLCISLPYSFQIPTQTKPTSTQVEINLKKNLFPCLYILPTCLSDTTLHLMSRITSLFILAHQIKRKHITYPLCKTNPHCIQEKLVAVLHTSTLTC